MWYARERTIKSLSWQIFNRKNLVVVLDFVAVANLKFPNYYIQGVSKKTQTIAVTEQRSALSWVFKFH